MRVALVVPGGIDPSEEFEVIPALLALLKRLAARHDVHVFALAQDRTAAPWSLYGATIHNLRRAGRRSPAGAALAYPREIFAILRQNRATRFDVVHAMWSGRCAVVAVAAAKLLGIPSIVHVTGGELVALRDIGYGGALTWVGRTRETLALRNATAVTATSAPIIQHIAALGIAARRVPLGVDLRAWPPRSPCGRPAGQPVRLIHIGSLSRVKDQATLLHALAHLAKERPAFLLDVVGDDTLDGRTQALAQQLGLADRVRFHGFLTQRTLRPLLEQAHINVVSSRHEAGPFVLLEAAAAGVPSVGTAVGHFTEWGPSAAPSVPVGDAVALATAIKCLIDDEPLRLQIATRAVARATAEDADYTADQFLGLYAELVRR